MNPSSFKYPKPFNLQATKVHRCESMLNSKSGSVLANCPTSSGHAVKKYLQAMPPIKPPPLMRLSMGGCHLQSSYQPICDYGQQVAVMAKSTAATQTIALKNRFRRKEKSEPEFCEQSQHIPTRNGYVPFCMQFVFALHLTPSLNPTSLLQFPKITDPNIAQYMVRRLTFMTPPLWCGLGRGRDTNARNLRNCRCC